MISARLYGLILAVTILSLFVADIAECKNMIKDPGINDIAAGHWLSWARRGKPVIKVDNTVGHSDNTSLMISSQEKGTDAVWLQNVYLIKWQTYEYSFWFRTAEPNGIVSFLAEFSNPDGVYMGQRNIQHRSNGTDWTYASGSFKSPVTGKALFDLWVNLDNAGTGTAWFDDISLKRSFPAKVDVDLGVADPIDHVIYDGLDKIKYSITQIDPYASASLKYKFIVKPENSDPQEFDGTVRGNSIISIPINKDISYGKVVLDMEIFDKHGDKIFNRSDIFMKQQKSAKVSIGNKRKLIVDGADFFPIIMFWPYLEDVKKLPDMGVNAFHIGLQAVETYKKFSEEAKRYGLMYMPEFSELLRYGKTEYDEVKNRVISMRDDPSLLGYMLIDEPNLLQSPPEVIRTAYNMIKELDPNHPVQYDEPGLCQILRYRNGADLIGIDPYLMPKQVANHVKTALGDDMAGQGKPVWIVIGICPMEGMPMWPESPSLPYIRSCVYSSLVAGAKGIFYFSHRFTNFDFNKSDFLDDFAKLNKEVTRLSPYLLKAEPKPIAVSDKDVIASVYDSVYGSLLLVVNTTKDRTIDTTIELPEYIGDVYGIFDGSITPCGGKIDIKLLPYGTKAYKLR